LAISLEKPLSFDTTYLPRRYIEEPQLEKDERIWRTQGLHHAGIPVAPSPSLRIPSAVQTPTG
jgi:hypothetical protein